MISPLIIQSEGQSLNPVVTIEDNKLCITWTIPKNPIAYDGAIVLVSPQELNPSNYPTNGVKYNASNDLTQPADMIGNAQVVAALYHDTLTNSIEVSNIDPDTTYYVSVHLATNTFQYYTQGDVSYSYSMESIAYAGKPKTISNSPPNNPYIGQVYYNLAQNLIFVWDGTKWGMSTSHTVKSGEVEPPANPIQNAYPVIGDYFYNTRLLILKIWNGVSWIDAESVKGTPAYSNIGSGTTGESGARENIKSILKHQLGYPVICVELQDIHFEIALNNALLEIRRRVDSAYRRQYVIMTMHRNQSIYYLNDVTLQTNKIVDVLKIHRINLLGLSTYGPDNIFAQQLLNHFYAPGVGFDLVSIHLIHSLSETYNMLFAGDIAFNWYEASRELHVYRKTPDIEKVLLECSMEKPEQELLTDRWTQQWIQQWAEAECMFMLAHIRGKFSSLPGPGGGLSLNADSLMTEGQRLQDDCLRQIKDLEVGQNGPDNFHSPFLMG